LKQAILRNIHSNDLKKEFEKKIYALILSETEEIFNNKWDSEKESWINLFGNDFVDRFETTYILGQLKNWKCYNGYPGSPISNSSIESFNAQLKRFVPRNLTMMRFFANLEIFINSDEIRNKIWKNLTVKKKDIIEMSRISTNLEIEIFLSTANVRDLLRTFSVNIEQKSCSCGQYLLRRYCSHLFKTFKHLNQLPLLGIENHCSNFYSIRGRGRPRGS
jgi:hypothetical protein